MATQNLYSCDFCNKSSLTSSEVLFERVVVENGKHSPIWEDICPACYEKLQKFILTLRKLK